MTETKGALKSTGVWGGVISLLPALGTILQALGFGVWLPAVDPLIALLSAVGGALATTGRVKAEKKILGLL